MDFNYELRKVRNKHWSQVLILTLIIVALWFVNTGKEPVNVTASIYLMYFAMLATGLGIWYGFNNYDKTAKLLKAKDSDTEKQNNYLSAVKFQNMITVGVCLIDIILWVVCLSAQFGYAAVCALIFLLITAPSQSKFENDFYEPVYLDEEMNEPEDESVSKDEPEDKDKENED